MKTTAKLWLGLAILAVLSPIGLLWPAIFQSGGAWGEWGIDTVKELVGYIPQGLGRLSSLWKAPFADYAFKSWEQKGPFHQSAAYLVSALIGIALVASAAWLIGKILSKKGN